MAKYRPQPKNVEFNMTPLIDVTFQLIIFFIITGQIVSEELAKLKVPKPTETQAIEDMKKGGLSVIVNIVSAAGDKTEEQAGGIDASRAEAWVVHGKPVPVDDMDALVRIFKDDLKKVSESERSKFTLELRSDYRVQYADVQTVMLAAADAGIANMNITAVTDPARNKK